MAVITLASTLVSCTPVKEPNKVPVGNFITGDSFDDKLTFDAGTDSKYVFDGSKIELTGGVARLKGVDQSDTSAAAFGSATSTVGASWGTNSVKLANVGGCDATSTNCSELNSSWTPGWASITGYWQLNGAGAIANSATVSATVGPTGTASNANGSGMTYSTGKLQSGVTFDGVDDYVNGGTTINPSAATSYSIAAWVKSATGAINQGIAGWWDGTNGLYIQSAVSGQGIVFLAGDANTFGAATYAIAGNWVHAVLVYDGTQTGNANRLRGYINGEPMTLTFNTGTVPASIPTLTGAQFRIGSLPTIGRFMQGSIDEVATFNRALTSSEIRHIYDRQSANFSGALTSRIMDSGITATTWTGISWISKLPALKALPDYSAGIQSETSASYNSLVSDTLMTGNVGLWHLNETATGMAPSGKDFADTSGSNNHGTIVNSAGATLGVAGKFGNSFLSKTGTSCIGLIGTTGSFNFIQNTGVFSISGWFKLNDYTSSAEQFLIGNANNAVQKGFYVSYVGTNKKVRASIATTGPLTGDVSTADNFFTNNLWHHFAYTGDGTYSRLYVDGALQATSASMVGNFASGLSSAIVGLGCDGGTNNYKFNGTLDEFAVWNRTLSPNEVSQVFARGASRIKFQARSCNASNCSDGAWKGPDGTPNTYFSELLNMSTQASAPSGTTLASTPAMLFSNFTSPPPANRYFQYRAVLESDSATAAMQPELQSVALGPTSFNDSQPTISNVTPIPYRKLADFVETLGVGGCTGGVRYTASFDGVNWLYWDGTQWTISDGSFSQADPASAFKDGFGSLVNIVSTDLYVRAHLNSSGTTACEIDQLSVSGTR